MSLNGSTEVLALDARAKAYEASERSIRNEVKVHEHERRIGALETMKDETVAAVFKATLWAVGVLGGTVLTAAGVIYALAR